MGIREGFFRSTALITSVQSPDRQDTIGIQEERGRARQKGTKCERPLLLSTHSGLKQAARPEMRRTNALLLTVIL
jgi:hypothetical protein